jgi:hypothetical protein
MRMLLNEGLTLPVSIWLRRLTDRRVVSANLAKVSLLSLRRARIFLPKPRGSIPIYLLALKISLKIKFLRFFVNKYFQDFSGRLKPPKFAFSNKIW